MIGSKYLPVERMTIAPTESSIAEYNYPTDVILFWDWSLKNQIWYSKNGENLLQMIVRVVIHEELHRILYFLEGTKATFEYDRVTRCNIDDLP